MRVSPQAPEPRLPGSCQERNRADGEHTARAPRGMQSLRRGWQPQPPRAARVSRLALRQQQLSRHTEPPLCVGGNPDGSGRVAPQVATWLPPPWDPAPSQTQTYRFSHSLPGA